MSDERLRYDLPMPCDPLGDLRAWQQRLERLSHHPADAWAPPIDVYETADAFVVTAEVPGLTRENVELAVEDSRLVIRGRREARPASGDTVHYHQVERGHGTFKRIFKFTNSIDGERISADLSDGVLTITVPKVAPPPPRKIDVR
jgi:HSP20 family protein